jgi:hypothetical protein
MKRSLLLIGFLVLMSGLMAQNYQKVIITYDKIGDGLYDFYAENPNFYPVQLFLDFPDFQNMTATCTLPYISTLEHGKHLLFQVKRVLLDIPGSFKHTFYTRIGSFPVLYNPNTVYQLPVSKGKATKALAFDNSKSDEPSKIMWGFSMSKGDSVLACREGVVCLISESKTVNGYRTGENSVTVLHPDNSFGKYEVFADSMMFVHLGDSVKTGSVLGIAGGENYQFGAHSRFSVYFVNARIDSIANYKIKNSNTYIDPLFQIGNEEAFKLKANSEYSN